MDVFEKFSVMIGLLLFYGACIGMAISGLYNVNERTLLVFGILTGVVFPVIVWFGMINTKER